MPVRQGIEMGKRVEFFKGTWFVLQEPRANCTLGDKLVSFLLEKSGKSKYCPMVQDKDAALRIGRQLIKEGYIHRSERDSKNKKMLTPMQDSNFVGNGYYK